MRYLGGMSPIELDHGRGLNGAIAGELRAERARRRVTFDALATRSGISKRTLIRMLNGERAINMASLEAICEVLGAPPSRIIVAAQTRLEEAMSDYGYTLAASDADYDAEIEAQQEEP